MDKHNDQERALFEAWRLENFCGGTERLKKCSNAPEVYYYTAEQDSWKVWQARAQLPAGGAVPALTDGEREDLWEFYQAVCCDAGHRVDKEGMRRLAAIGAVESVGFGKHRLTEFGAALLAAAPHPVSGEQKPVAVVDESDDGQWADILPDVSVRVGDKLYAAPPAPPAPPAAQDVAGLVEALEACRKELLFMINKHNVRDDSDGSWLYDHQTVCEADAALAAHRAKQGVIKSGHACCYCGSEVPPPPAFSASVYCSKCGKSSAATAAAARAQQEDQP